MEKDNSKEKTTVDKQDVVQKRPASKKESCVRFLRKNIMWIMIGIVALLGVALYLSSSDKKDDASDTNEEVSVDMDDSEQWSYALGYTLGEQLQQMLAQDPTGVDIDYDTLTKAINDVLSEKKTRLSEAQIQKIMEARAQKEQEMQQEKVAENKAKGDAYIKEYSQKEAVQKTESGVLYTVKTVGTGAPVGENIALVHYRGKLIDGTEFDSSYTTGEEPVPFNPLQMIPGVGETLSLMKKGSAWEIVVPADQAYGDAGVPSLIEPGSTLIFEIDIVDIEKNTQ